MCFKVRGQRSDLLLSAAGVAVTASLSGSEVVRARHEGADLNEWVHTPTFMLALKLKLKGPADVEGPNSRLKVWVKV